MAEQEAVEQPDTSAADEAAGFAAGFNAVEPEEANPEVSETPEIPDPASLEAIAADDALLPGYTPEQIKTLLAKSSEVDTLKTQYDKLSGHIGTLLQEVKTLKAPKADALQVALPKMDDAALESFRESYPEFAAYVANHGPAAQVPADLIERVTAAETRNAELARQLEERTIAILHPDWTDVVGKDDYKVWLATQPPEVQTTATTTASAMELGKVLSSYKDFAGKQQTRITNKARLEGALVPNGAQRQTLPAEPTEADAFRAGWNSIK